MGIGTSRETKRRNSLPVKIVRVGRRPPSAARQNTDSKPVQHSSNNILTKPATRQTSPDAPWLAYQIENLETMDSLTDFEISLLPQLWSKLTTTNPYYFEHVFNRLFEVQPDMELLMEGRNTAQSSSSNSSNTSGKSLSRLSRSLRSFFRGLIDDKLQRDRQLAASACKALGRRHAVYAPAEVSATPAATANERPPSRARSAISAAMNLSSSIRAASPRNRDKSAAPAVRPAIGPHDWMLMRDAMVDEFGATLSTEDVEQRELETLAWSRFVDACVFLVCQGYDQAIIVEANKAFLTLPSSTFLP